MFVKYANCQQLKLGDKFVCIRKENQYKLKCVSQEDFDISLICFEFPSLLFEPQSTYS